MITESIHHLDGRRIATTIWFDIDSWLGNSWTWIKSRVAEEFECHPDDVSLEERPGGDVITVADRPVARIVDGVTLQ